VSHHLTSRMIGLFNSLLKCACFWKNNPEFSWGIRLFFRWK
jgi:hypothetical protein